LSTPGSYSLILWQEILEKRRRRPDPPELLPPATARASGQELLPPPAMSSLPSCQDPLPGDGDGPEVRMGSNGRTF
uniref:Uncharacterized protein n=1 Tax=Aegilops tauschii subsp. strangulata TaxID=200361 RepID=A0A453JSQ4_AEGTS